MQKNGAKGIVMCSNPHDSGMPNLLNLNGVHSCNLMEMPINFHIGASEEISTGQDLFRMTRGSVT